MFFAFPSWRPRGEKATMKLTRRNIIRFHTYIFRWWKVHKRDLPWRKTHDPYKILLSEILLQQTQVVRGLPKYKEFIAKYPTIKSLARARLSDVLRIWKGMGYNRRALYLHKTANFITSDYNGIFPQDEKTLQKLPGIGKYTARAVLVFAYKKDLAMVDTNIRKIITHFFFDDVLQDEKNIEDIAQRLLPLGKSWEWHQALMDYGALHEKELRSTNIKKSYILPFKKTNRYFRGRILDLVREQSFQEKALISVMEKQYEIDQKKVKLLVQGLLKDGLLMARSGGIICLPE